MKHEFLLTADRFPHKIMHDDYVDFHYVIG